MKAEKIHTTLANRALWQIETRLAQPLSLQGLSDLCAVSPYHLCRTFHAQTGLSPMTYQRARRLSVAARELATSDAKILSVALDAQYNSHEAFTRAFFGYFNALPRTIRAKKSTHSLIMMEPLNMDKSQIVDVAAPEIRTRDAFRVIGLSARCTFEDTAAIPGLWQAFNERENEVASRGAASAFGVCCDADGSGKFRYVAGIQAAPGAEIPGGMDDVAIPSSRYAVFTHSGHISDFPKTVYTVWNKALPDAGLDPANSPGFELYDSRFNPKTGRGDVEIWIPVN